MSLPVALNVEALNVFPGSYRQARARFLERVSSCSLTQEQQSYPVSGVLTRPDTVLSTELAWLGSRQAARVLVLISATHGIEGFVGAAVQNDLLARFQEGYALANDTAVLLVFALNPYGFAYHRRCDEKGIDLNRNFVDFNKALPANPGYQDLQASIYQHDPGLRDMEFQRYRDICGRTAFEIAISGGQYTDPDGPFFGGHEPAHGRRVIEHLSELYQLDSRQLAIIDVHSGLGPYAHGEVINDHPLKTPGYEVANLWYGASVTAPATGNSSSVNKQGLLDYHWHALMPQRGCCVTLEFGSYHTERLFDVILEDHRAWKAFDTDAMRDSAVAMQEHFCPRDSYWQELVLIKARQVIQQALDGLRHG